MLVIRKDQMETFQKVALQRFEDEMVVHSQNFSPELCSVIGDAQLRFAVRFAMTRAKSYGFTNRGSIRLFIEMMFLFGSSFDTDPQYPWSARILADSSEQMQRAKRLYEKIIDYQDKVSGPNAVNTIEALWNLSFLPTQPFNYNTNNFVSGMLQEMTSIFPQKAAYLGNEALQALIHSGVTVAQQARFPSARAYTLIIALMYAFGHGCSHDPLYPWIANTLLDEKIVDPAARAERLEKKALTWLNHVLANLSGKAQS